jgi:hypothetical protein
MATAEWVERAYTKRNNELKENGINQHDFLWLHLNHGVEEKIIPVNSTEADPSTGDPEPVFGKQLFCPIDNVTSAIE